jgi:LPPG:FO 2-phospho-L-lactate transferase
MSASGRRGRGRVLALSGGVGGAKLAAGLAAVLAPQELTVVVNTGDDFEHLGLHVAPDIDSVVYALAGRNDPVRGWGRADESWHFMAALRELGGEDWFSLGDRDLAMHVLRSDALRRGQTLSQATARLAAALRIRCEIVPMSDAPVRTIVHTDEGPLAFQDYFVRRRCEPRVTGLAIDGAASAPPAPAFLDALHDRTLRAVVICPSNPFLSVDPMLALPGVRDALAACAAPVVAVSPIVAGAAVKGPAAKILRELGREVAPTSIAAHYAGLVDGLVIDAQDAAMRPRLPLEVCVTATLMTGPPARERLARDVLGFADGLREAAVHPAARAAAPSTSRPGEWP